MDWKPTYVALLRGPLDGPVPAGLRKAIAAHAPDLVARVDADGLLILAGRDVPVRASADGALVLVGPLYDQRGDTVRIDLPGALPPRSDAALLATCWGRYVAFRAAGPGRWEVLLSLIHI